MSLRLDLYFDEKDRLNFRAVNKACLEIARKAERTPYSTKKAFVIGLSGQIDNNNQLPLRWTQLWMIYHFTILSPSDKPALIYKLREFKSGKFATKLEEFREGEDLKKSFRQYDVLGLHCWATNEAWVLAQIHRGRSFTIFSDVSDKNKMRENLPDIYSAFTREITAAMMAGYTPTITKDGDVGLQAPSDIVARNISIDKIRADDATTEKLYQSLMFFSKTTPRPELSQPQNVLIRALDLKIDSPHCTQDNLYKAD